MHHTTHPMKSVAKSWTMMMPSPMQHIPLPSSLMNNISTHNSILCCDFNYVNLSNQRGTRLLCSARRQIRYQDDGDDKDSDEEYGHNEEIAKLESYSQSAKGEVLLVHALVDQEEVDVLIFKVSLFHILYANKIIDLIRVLVGPQCANNCFADC